MQLIDTKVNDFGTELTVEFVGEGGETVVVRMNNDDHLLDGENAINHAKAVMVQLTAFDDPAIARPGGAPGLDMREADPLADSESLLPGDVSH
ncbi:hypothetical protein [Rhizobium grahamii]|uniref:Uncharacterized protein n=1 Tax=Rhizobium grahamii TaxID=1120045 RepID=A0A370KFG7_9HYPH|nr:hypothetical protein [Rhizobium grahamii]RDJ03144.1 hypothetical protein B5K06_30535 [Rhizobium grahamii]